MFVELIVLFLVAVFALSITRALKRSRTPGFGRKYVTMHGEVVKSYGEKVIADYFHSRGIRYMYEKPFYGRDEYGRRRRLSRPDFYLPDFKTWVEYFGMVDSPDRKTRDMYCKQIMWKIDRYVANNAVLIPVFPQDLNRLDRIFAPGLGSRNNDVIPR